MEVGKLVWNNVAGSTLSLYKDKQEFLKYFFMGWTPVTSKNTWQVLHPFEPVMFLGTINWERETLAKILHGEQTYYVIFRYLSEVEDNKG